MHNGSFQKGHKKTGGRQKGTLNKPAQQVKDICEQLGCNPFEFMALVVMNKLPKPKKGEELRFLITLDHRIACAKELASYIAPKRRSVEMTGTVTTMTPAEELAQRAMEAAAMEDEDEPLPN